jgi:hypothetical protein
MMGHRTAAYLWDVLGLETTTQETVRFEEDNTHTTFITVRATTIRPLFQEAVEFARDECEEFDNALVAANLISDDGDFDSSSDYD